MSERMLCVVCCAPVTGQDSAPTPHHTTPHHTTPHHTTPHHTTPHHTTPHHNTTPHTTTTLHDTPHHTTPHHWPTATLWQRPLRPPVMTPPMPRPWTWATPGGQRLTRSKPPEPPPPPPGCQGHCPSGRHIASATATLTVRSNPTLRMSGSWMWIVLSAPMEYWLGGQGSSMTVPGAVISFLHTITLHRCALPILHTVMPHRSSTVAPYRYSLPLLSTVTLYRSSLPLLSTVPLYRSSLPLLSTVPLYRYSLPLLSTVTLYRYSLPLLTVTPHCCSTAFWAHFLGPIFRCAQDAQPDPATSLAGEHLADAVRPESPPRVASFGRPLRHRVVPSCGTGGPRGIGTWVRQHREGRDGQSGGGWPARCGTPGSPGRPSRIIACPLDMMPPDPLEQTPRLQCHSARPLSPRRPVIVGGPAQTLASGRGTESREQSGPVVQDLTSCQSAGALLFSKRRPYPTDFLPRTDFLYPGQPTFCPANRLFVRPTAVVSSQPTPCLNNRFLTKTFSAAIRADCELASGQLSSPLPPSQRSCCNALHPNPNPCPCPLSQIRSLPKPPSRTSRQELRLRGRPPCP